MTRAGKGVLYVATGAAHTAAARASAASVRATNPWLGVAIYTDQAIAGPEFDSVAPVAAPHIRAKVDYLPETPFAETLYLDTDTRVLGDLGDLFRLLERFDLALAQRALRAGRARRRRSGAMRCRSSFPQGNGGVCSTAPRRRRWASWRRGGTPMPRRGSRSTRSRCGSCSGSSDIRVAVLPGRFNTRRYTWLHHWLTRHAAAGDPAHQPLSSDEFGPLAPLARRAERAFRWDPRP